MMINYEWPKEETSHVIEDSTTPVNVATNFIFIQKIHLQ